MRSTVRITVHEETEEGCSQGMARIVLVEYGPKKTAVACSCLQLGAAAGQI